MRGRKEPTVNQYGTTAEKHFRVFLPDRYAQIEDPRAFFDEMGQQMAQEIDLLADQFAGDDPPGEEYLEKVGRLTAARQMARERVLAETLPDPETPTT